MEKLKILFLLPDLLGIKPICKCERCQKNSLGSCDKPDLVYPNFEDPENFVKFSFLKAVRGRPDPLLYVLRESTSSLDSIYEGFIYDVNYEGGYIDLKYIQEQAQKTDWVS